MPTAFPTGSYTLKIDNVAIGTLLLATTNNINQVSYTPTGGTTQGPTDVAWDGDSMTISAFDFDVDGDTDDFDSGVYDPATDSFSGTVIIPDDPAQDEKDWTATKD